MRIPFVLAGAQLRRGWRALVGLTLMIGLVAGLVLAGFAGSERTQTAVDRMIDATAAGDVLVNPDQGDFSALDFDRVAALPMVTRFSHVHGVGVAPTEPQDSIDDWFNSGPFTFASDGGSGFEFDRPVISNGRMPDPAATDEIYLDRAYADRAGISVGDTVEWRIVSGEEINVAFSAGDESQILAALNDPHVGTMVKLKVVGVGTTLDGIAVDTGYEPTAAFMTPALYDQLGQPSIGYGGAVVRLRDPADMNAFKAAVDAMAPNEKIVYQTLAASREKAIRATEPSATALAIFALITLALGVLVIGQAIGRRFQLDATDNDTMAALGTTRFNRFLATMIRLTVTAVSGVVLGVAMAYALSHFTPVGPAWAAETDPGLSFDAGILLIGAAAAIVLLLLIGVVPAWRSARRSDHSWSPDSSTIARWLAECGAPPHVTTGVRFGLESGRGTSAVPTRATIIGALSAVAIAVATIVFASSLDRVVHDGKFYGSNYDLAIDFDGDVVGNADEVADVLATVKADPAVDQVGEIRINEISVNGETLPAITFNRGDGAVEPTIGAGQEPASADQIALGGTTMKQLGVNIGDRVQVHTSGFDGDATVVGRAVLPGVGLYQGSDRTSIGLGALVPTEALGPRIADGTDSEKGLIAVRLAKGADREAFQQRMSAAFDQYEVVQFRVNARPSDIDSLARLRSIPTVLSALLVGMVTVTVVNAMVVAVRRRRRDIAIFQTLGSTTGDVVTMGVWQGITIGTASLIFGIPLGIIGGRWLWTVLANKFGTLAEPVVPMPGVLVLAAVVMVLAATTGAIPVKRGLRHHPADVLRTE